MFEVLVRILFVSGFVGGFWRIVKFAKYVHRFWCRACDLRWDLPSLGVVMAEPRCVKCGHVMKQVDFEQTWLVVSNHGPYGKS